MQKRALLFQLRMWNLWIYFLIILLVPYAKAETPIIPSMKLNPLYIANMGNFVPDDFLRLEGLYRSGINSIIVGGDLNYVVQLINGPNGATWKKFKYIAHVDSQVRDVLKCTSASPRNTLAACAKSFGLTASIDTIENNRNYFVAVNTLDEPMCSDIDATFGTRIKNFIQTMAPTLPVIVTQSVDCSENKKTVVNGSLQWVKVANPDEIASRMRKFVSVDSQDIYFFDNYQNDPEKQRRYLQRLADGGHLSKSYLFILPAIDFDYNRDKCEYVDLIKYGNMILNAIPSPSDRPEIFRQQFLGFGYFAYWPGKKPDFTYDMSNCAAFNDSVRRHQEFLQHQEVSNNISFLQPSGAYWANEWGYQLSFGVDSNGNGNVWSVFNYKVEGNRLLSGFGMMPPNRSSSSTKGIFPVTSLAANRKSYLSAEIALDGNYTCGNGVRVYVILADAENKKVFGVPAGGIVDLYRTIPATGRQTVFIDLGNTGLNSGGLSNLSGKDIEVSLQLESGNNFGCDHLVISKLRVIPQSDRALGK